MTTEQRINNKLSAELRPLLLEIENESHRHSGPATDSHFKLTLVSEEFADQTRVVRHQRVYQLLADELAGGIHALSLHLYSPAEWQQRDGATPASPDCRGGSKQ
ncbi:MAG: BolA family protein [Pseudohongiellaceae bacterium]